MTTIANAALFVVNAYHAYKDAEWHVFLDEKALPLPKDWQLFEVYDHTANDGDYAAVFVNRVTEEIFIAGRGTATLGDTHAYPDILLGIAPAKRIESAQSILAIVRGAFQGYHIQAGGHSLDGLVWAKVSARDQSYTEDREYAPISVLAMNAPNTKLSAADINGYSRVVAIVENLDAVGHYGPDYANVIQLDAAFGFLNQFGAEGTHSVRNLLLRGVALNSYLLEQELAAIDPIAVIGGGVAAISWYGQSFVEPEAAVHSHLQEDGILYATTTDRLGNKYVYQGVIGATYPRYTEQIDTRPDGIRYATSTFFDPWGRIVSVSNTLVAQGVTSFVPLSGIAGVDLVTPAMEMRAQSLQAGVYRLETDKIAAVRQIFSETYLSGRANVEQLSVASAWSAADRAVDDLTNTHAVTPVALTAYASSSTQQAVDLYRTLAAVQTIFAPLPDTVRSAAFIAEQDWQQRIEVYTDAMIDSMAATDPVDLIDIPVTERSVDYAGYQGVFQPFFVADGDPFRAVENI